MQIAYKILKKEDYMKGEDVNFPSLATIVYTFSLSLSINNFYLFIYTYLVYIIFVH